MMRARNAGWIVVLSICCITLVGCRGKTGDDPQEILGPGILVPGDNPMGGFDFNLLTSVDTAESRALKSSTVYFGYDSYQVADAELRKIEAAAEYLRTHRKHVFVNEGNCDERGSREYNLSLGEHRAQAVRAYLIRLGINGNRIQTKSYGEENPAAAGHHEGAWRMNRRVEFDIYSY